MKLNTKTSIKFSLLIMLVLMVACGGEKGNNTSEADKSSDESKIAYSSITGTAFGFTTLNNSNVTANCKDGVGFKDEVKVDAQGKWQGQIDSSKFPCRLEVKANEQSYHSYISQAGSVNINPLTDLTITYASMQLPNTWYQSGMMTEEKLKSANAALVAELIKKEYSLDSKTDLFTTEIKTANPLHLAIQALFEAIQGSNTIENYNALLTLVKDGNLTQLPAKSDKVVINPLNIIVNTAACQQYDSGMIERYNYCASNVLPDFKEDQLITPFGEKCILTKAGSTLTVSNGKLTISAFINGEEEDEILSKSSVGVMFVASNPVSSSLDDVLYNVAISLLPDGQINGVTAGNEKGEPLVCSTTRVRA